MKDALTSVDLFHLIREFQSLIGARLDKVYQGVGLSKRDLTFQFHKKDAPKQLIRAVLPGLLYFASEKVTYEQIPGDFAMFVRRHIGNARLLKVQQIGFDRIVEFTFENKNGQFKLVLEMVTPGNALLLNAQGKIINLLEPKKTSQRVLRGGATYEPLEPQFNTILATEQQIIEKLQQSDKESIVKTLAIELGLGGDYAEEVCVRAQITKTAKQLTTTDYHALVQALKSLFEQSDAYQAGSELFALRMTTKNCTTEYSSLSQGIETILAPRQAAQAVIIAAGKPKKDKAQEIMRTQQLALETYHQAAAEQQQKGELLYAHYQRVEKLLEQIKEAKKTLSWEQIKTKFKDNIIGVDEKNGSVIIELE